MKAVNSPYTFLGPLHEQVLSLLRSRIISGEWSGGHPLPSETHLSRDFGVSLGTMRKAMDRLVQDRVIVRERGRGTFINEPTTWRTERGLKLCRTNGASVSADIRIVKTADSIATAEEIEALGIQPNMAGQCRVFCIFREWLIDGNVVCFEKISIEPFRFPELHDIARSSAERLQQVYSEHYKAKIDREVWLAKPVKAEEISKRFTQLNNELFLQISRVSFDQKGTAVEYCEQVHACIGQAFQWSG